MVNLFSHILLVRMCSEIEIGISFYGKIQIFRTTDEANLEINYVDISLSDRGLPLGVF